MSEFIGKSVSDGRFLIERELGRGGTGVVLEAVDVLLKRQVAIKIITSQSEVSAQRFEREVRTLAAVKCQHIPEIYTWGRTDEGLPFIVMELLEYSTLESLLSAQNVLPDTDVCAIAIEITKALSIIHDAKIVHRDLKPSNVMVRFDSDEGWSIKLLDFGLVHLLAPDQRLTQTENVLGSIGYFSPEHATPQLIDCRSDIFSLGCILFRSLTGEPPFEAENLFASILLMNSDVREQIPPSIPVYLKEIVWKCLQSDPAKRFQNAAELREALESKQPLVTVAEVGSIRSRSGLNLTLVALSAVAIITLGSALTIFYKKEQNPYPELTLARSLQSAANSNSLEEQKRILKELDVADGFWTHSSRQNRDDLRKIARAQFANSDIAAGDLAFDCVLKSLRAKLAPTEEWIETLSELVGHHIDLKCPTDETVADAKEAVALSAPSPSRLKHAHFMLATVYNCRDDVENALSSYKSAQQISADTRERVFDGEVATTYARFLNKHKREPAQVSRLLEFSMQNFRQSLEDGEKLNYQRCADLYSAVEELKDQPNADRLYRDSASFLSRASQHFPHGDEQLQAMTAAASIKLKYDKPGAISDLRQILKLAERNKSWTHVISTVSILADNKLIERHEISRMINRNSAMPRDVKEKLNILGEKLKS